MSTKTLRKRIALVAVSALGAGLLSVVAAPSANAVVGTTPVSSLQIATTASTTGEGSANQAIASATSSGWVAQTSTTAAPSGGVGLNLTGGNAATGVVLAGARIGFSVSGPANGTSSNISVVVTGGTINSLGQDTPDTTANGTATTANGTLSVNGSSTTAVLVQLGTTSAKMHGRFAVSAAAGTTATIAAYAGAGIAGTTTATNGALLGIWTFTVATASASGTFSAADSTIAVQAPYVKGTTASGLLTYDDTSRIANGSVGAIYVALADAFSAAITTGIVTATATNGALVNINDGAPAAGHDYAAVSAFDSETDLAGGDAYISVTQPVAGVAGSTTVTITLNGAVIATKTLNWNGDAASISVDSANSASSFKNAYAAYASWTAGDFLNVNVRYTVKDAAGNVLDLGTSVPTVSDQTGSMVGASLSTDADVTGTAAAGNIAKQYQTGAIGYGLGTMLIPASALQGAGTYKLKFVNGSGASLYTPAISAIVSNGGLNSFVASWDKASYSPGDIAVLTVSGKDAFGNRIADGTAAAGLSASVSGSTSVGFTTLGTACDATNQVFAGGVFTCKYAANTEGAWSYTVDMTTATPQAATVGSLKITAGGATSNADVLKAIVSLIASINKQIAALQKALLRR
jgi:trimeric autotransporter adhesin